MLSARLARERSTSVMRVNTACSNSWRSAIIRVECSVTRRMLETLVADLAILRAVDSSLTVSFNASARDFDDDRLVDAIVRLRDLGLVAAGELEVELTESAVHGAGPALAELLGLLRSRGVDLAMDDFGTGYSSITLSKLPFSALKIDQGIVGRMETSAKDASIVESSIRMGHRIGLDIGAELLRNAMRIVVLFALALAIPSCSAGQPPLHAEPSHASMFGDTDVTITGELSSLGTIREVTIGGVRGLDARGRLHAYAAQVARSAGVFLAPPLTWSSRSGSRSTSSSAFSSRSAPCGRSGARATRRTGIASARSFRGRGAGEDGLGNRRP